MRMQIYRMVLSAGAMMCQRCRANGGIRTQSPVVRSGDAERPLFVPWDEAAAPAFCVVERDWAAFRTHLSDAAMPAWRRHCLGNDARRGHLNIDAFVAGIEAHVSRWTLR